MWPFIALAVAVFMAAAPVADGQGVRVNNAPLLTPERLIPAVFQPEPVVVQQPVVVPQQQQQPALLQQQLVPFLVAQQPQVFMPPPQPMLPQVLVQPPVFVPQQQQQQQQPAQQTQPGTPRGGPLACPFSPDTMVHATHRGREYHFSWCRQPGVTFTFEDAQDYCEELPRNGHPVGFNTVSIENQDEDNFIRNRISEYRVPYIWTSGRRVSRNFWRWQSSIASQYNNWSHTGAAGRQQPDNFFNNENCLAVLNNFYHDGIRWHDIPCDLDKYVVCER